MVLSHTHTQMKGEANYIKSYDQKYLSCQQLMTTITQSKYNYNIFMTDLRIIKNYVIP